LSQKYFYQKLLKSVNHFYALELASSYSAY